MTRAMYTQDNATNQAWKTIDPFKYTRTNHKIT